jgi:hypothetical protein
MAAPLEYPWFAIVDGDELQQGDMLRGCPRFVLPPDASEDREFGLDRQRLNAIIVTQSCDLAIRANGQCEVKDVLLCRFYGRKELATHQAFGKDDAWEDVRKGRRPYFHVLNECVIEGHEQDFVLVDFHDLFTLPVALVREVARRGGERLRLLPPYREHLSQAFARLFMRVGLPTDVPPFGKRK